MARWVKGQSGNPAGRRKEEDVKALIRSYAPDMISTLYKIAMNPKSQDRARVMAANSLLDRGLGKPVQPLGGDGGGDIIVKIVKFAADDDPDHGEG